MPEDMHRDTGRPSNFTEALADRIFDRLGDGASLSEVCQDEAMPHRSTVYRWLAQNEAFRRQYAVACELRAEGMGDAILNIADTASPEDTQRARLMVDTRKWLMVKLAPKKYGDKIANEISGPNGGPVEVKAITDMDRAKALAAMMARTLAQAPSTPAK